MNNKTPLAQSLEERLADLVPPHWAPPEQVLAYKRFNTLRKEPNKKPFGRGLKEFDIQLIRYFALNLVPLNLIAEVFKISYYSVRDIKSLRTWSHLLYCDPFGPSPEVVYTQKEKKHFDLLPPEQPFNLVLDGKGNYLMDQSGKELLLSPCTLQEATAFILDLGPDFILETITTV